MKREQLPDERRGYHDGVLLVFITSRDTGRRRPRVGSTTFAINIEASGVSGAEGSAEGGACDIEMLRVDETTRQAGRSRVFQWPAASAEEASKNEERMLIFARRAFIAFEDELKDELDALDDAHAQASRLSLYGMIVWQYLRATLTSIIYDSERDAFDDGIFKALDVIAAALSSRYGMTLLSAHIQQ
jgi:hypothetical protein